MRILKRRDKVGKTTTIRVPDAIKVGLNELRERADAAGFVLRATLGESLTRAIRLSLSRQARSHSHSSGAGTRESIHICSPVRG